MRDQHGHTVPSPSCTTRRRGNLRHRTAPADVETLRKRINFAFVFNAGNRSRLVCAAINDRCQVQTDPAAGVPGSTTCSLGSLHLQQSGHSRTAHSLIDLRMRRHVAQGCDYDKCRQAKSDW